MSSWLVFEEQVLLGFTLILRVDVHLRCSYIALSLKLLYGACRVCPMQIGHSKFDCSSFPYLCLPIPMLACWVFTRTLAA